MEKDKVLEKLASMTPDDLSDLRDRKLVELKDVLHQYHKAKDDELVARHEKRKKFLEEGNSLSKTEQLLKGDEELFQLKRLVSQMGDLKSKLKLEVEIASNYYWKNKT